MEELKKCPFCGGEAMLKIHYGFDEKVISAFVYCEEQVNWSWEKE